MRKIYLLAFSSVITAVSLAQSPISLTSANFPGSGDTLRYSNAQLSSVGDYTQTGANYNWDYSNLVYTSQGRRDFLQGILTPYGFFFSGATEYGEKVADTLGAGPLTITNYYSFYKKQTSPINAYIADGVGMTFSSIPVPSYYTDKDELYVLPITYPHHDSTTFKFSTPTTTALPLRYSKQGYRITDVDGWGSVTTPFGTANCIRVVTTQYSKDTVKISSPFPFNYGFLNYMRSYQWLTAVDKIPFLEVSGTVSGTSGAFTPTQARYRNSYQNPTGVQEISDISAMQFYPNPGKDKLWLNFTRKGEFNVEIHDLTGKLLKTGNFNSEIMGQSIDISDLSVSLYVIRITEKQTTYYYKFVKE